MADLTWQERALCKETDPDAFHPEKGGSTREAKRICGRCEVRDECLEYALAHDERHGIWGGKSERERKKLRREESEPGKRPKPPNLVEVRRLAAARLNDRQIGEELGMTAGAVERLRSRHGIPAGQPQPGNGRLVDRVRAVV